jgi:hypothetical protein
VERLGVVVSMFLSFFPSHHQPTMLLVARAATKEAAKLS